MKLSKNLIAFKNKAVLTDSILESNNIEQASVLQHVLMGYGYILTEQAFTNVAKLDTAQIVDIEKDIVAYLKDMMGSSKAKELKELTAAGELGVSIYTSLHSFFDLVWAGETSEAIQETYEYVQFKKIISMSEASFKGIFTNLIKINVPLTQEDFDVVDWFAKEYGKDNIMPNVIPLKENLCRIAALGLGVPVKTPTDVLRIAFFMSTGKSDLLLEPSMVKASGWSKTLTANPDKKNTYFKKFKRSERRYLLNLIDQVANATEMVLRRGMWINLGNILHPGEYKGRYPKAFEAFDRLRNKSVTSWYGQVDAQFVVSFDRGLNRLAERPGEFARRIDSLLRNNPKQQIQILLKFKEVGDKISSKVLWELYTHFQERAEQRDRSVWIKGARRPTPLPTLQPMDSKLIDEIQSVIWKIFFDKFSSMDKLGAVYIDEALRKIPLPTNMSTLSEGLVVATRGTRLPLAVEKKVLRTYIHWTAGVDLDLSMIFVGDKTNKASTRTATCSFTDTKPFAEVSHSGDIIPRSPGHYAEYIDVDLENIKYKYGLLTVHNFSGGDLKSVGATVGFMERDNKRGGNITWLPKTVTNAVKMNSRGSNVNLIIIDFEAQEWIMVDESQEGTYAQNRDIATYIKGLSELPAVSAYDILKLHAEARGNQVMELEKAETIFEFKDFSTSYEKIAAYMI